jgi:hypothetical protein
MEQQKIMSRSRSSCLRFASAATARCSGGPRCQRRPAQLATQIPVTSTAVAAARASGAARLVVIVQVTGKK